MKLFNKGKHMGPFKKVVNKAGVMPPKKKGHKKGHKGGMPMQGR